MLINDHTDTLPMGEESPINAAHGDDKNDTLPMAEEAPLGPLEQLLHLAETEGASAFWKSLKGETLDALRSLRDDDPSEYQSFRIELKSLKKQINVTALDKLLQGESDGPPQSQATELASEAAEKCELWHDADGDAFASLTGPAGELQHWRIDSTGYRDWLSHLAYSELGIVPSTDALKAAMNALSGRAKFDGAEHKPARRVAKTEGGHWLDISDEAWRAIHLTPTGWSIVDRPPVRFLRTKATRALPLPAPHGDVSLLWNLVNVPENDRVLVLAWILECWRADTPYAVLEISGEQGAAKSTAQRILRGFIDPNEVPLRGRPKAVEDIFVAAGNAHLLSFENLSTLSADMSDALCAVSTGAGFAGRMLYTNAEESLIKAHRPAVLNGINAVVTRPDLLDRAICLHLPRLTERLTDAEISAAVNETAPVIFAGLLDLFCSVLKMLPAIQAEDLKLPRMADFAQLGEAVARLLGYEPGHFLNAYAAHRATSIQRTIDASPVAAAIVRFVESGRSFRGPVGDLLETLNRNRPDHEATDYWPKSPRGLGDALRRYSPALAQIGIRADVEATRRRDGVHCEVTAMGQKFFFQPGKANFNVHEVHNVHQNHAPVNVVNIVNVESQRPPAKKELSSAADIITTAEVDL